MKKVEPPSKLYKIFQSIVNEYREGKIKSFNRNKKFEFKCLKKFIEVIKNNKLPFA